ncbi:hypothetical protein HYW53_01855 [Candidatus Giovannonibacteria bacterium]|nr:hypothetical protein [Candidatus Giovannonibacteria bacterium]
MIFRYKFFRIPVIMLALAFFALVYFVSAGSADDLSGWAWSENIGWISFNSVNLNRGANYGVRISNSGNLSGYAWSENIGWISFNENSGCPKSPCVPRLNRDTGEVSGWARALSADNKGWDGWISFRGSGYGVTVSNCLWDGWAWGSDVVGWVHFKGAGYGVAAKDQGCIEEPLPPPPPPLVCPSGQVRPHRTCEDEVCKLVDSCGVSSCTSSSECKPKKVTQCSDGIDNDGDAKVDYRTSPLRAGRPSDPGCSSLEDDNERNLIIEI